MIGGDSWLFFKSGIFSYSNKIALLVTGFLYTFLIANALGPESYGLAMYVMAFVGNLAFLFGAEPLGNALMVFTPKYRSRKLFLKFAKFILLVSLLLFAVFFLFSNVISNALDMGNAGIFQVSAYLLLLFPGFLLFEALFRGLKNFGKVLKVSVFESLSNLCLAAFFVLYLGQGITGLFTAKAISLAASIAVYVFLLSRQKFEEKKPEMPKVKKYLDNAVKVSILKKLNFQALIVFMGLYIPTALLGLYFIAEKLISYAVQMPIIALCDAMLPFASGRARDKKSLSRFVSLNIKFSLTLGLVLGAIAVLVGGFLLGALFPEYVDAYWLFPFFIAVFLGTSVQFISNAYRSINRVDIVAKSWELLLYLTLSLGFVLIYRFSLTGLLLVRIGFNLVIGAFLLANQKKAGLDIQIIPRFRDLKLFYSLGLKACRKVLKKTEGMLSAAIFAFLLFAGVLIVVSYWIGFFALSTPLALAVSLPLAFFLWKKFKPKPERIPVPVVLAALLVAGICAFPLLAVHPFYMGSNDALQTTTLRTLSIQGRIPETYAPFSDISFTYPIGLQLLAKPFSDLLFFAEDYLVLWAFGVLFAFIETILVFLAAKELFKSDKAGIWASIVFIGTKVVFINMYFGMFHRMLASCFVLAFLYLFLKRNKLSYAMLPAVIAVHPGMLINFALLMVAWLAFTRREFIRLLKVVPAGLAALPSYFHYYSSYISKMLLGGAGKAAGQALNFYSFTLAFVLGLGWAPAAFFGLCLAYSVVKRSFGRKKLFALAVFLIGSFFYYFSAYFNFTVDNVYPWLFSLGAVFFIAVTLSEIKIKKIKAEYLYALAAVLMLAGFAGSGYLTARIPGTKITGEEAAFAVEFKKLDPELKTVIFLGMHSAKPAELSNKIPFNTNREWFLPVEERISAHDAAYAFELEKSRIHSQILEEKCAECVLELGVDYAAVNIEEFPELPGIEPVLEHGGIKLYKLK